MNEVQIKQTISGLEKLNERFKGCHRLAHDEEMISREELEAVPSAIRILKATHESAKEGIKSLT